MAKTISILLTLAVSLGLVMVAQTTTPVLAASSQMYEHYSTVSASYVALDGNTWFAQTFTPSIAHPITSVKLKLARGGTPGTITVGIRATSGGQPTGSDLCFGTTNGNTLPGFGVGFEWRGITLGSGYSLSAGTTYAIVVRAPNGDFNNSLCWQSDSPGTYAGGTGRRSLNSGSSWTLFNVDFGFEEYGDPCVATSTGTGAACFSSSAGSIDALTAVATPSGAPVQFPYGMFSFKVTGLSAGQTVTLNVTLPGPVPVGTKWYKYNGGAWDPMDIGSDNGDNFITVTLQEGVLPDDEDTDPNQITDQGGPGYGAVGWETYPVSKVRVLLPWIALAVVLVGGTGWYVRRRLMVHR